MADDILNEVALKITLALNDGGGTTIVEGDLLLTDGVLQAPCRDIASHLDGIDFAVSAGEMAGASEQQGTGKTFTSNCLTNYIFSSESGTIQNINLAREDYTEEPMVIVASNPYSTIRNQAPDELSERDDAALRELGNMLSRPRLSPRDELKLGDPDPEMPGIIMREPPFPCEWYTILKMGGPYASVCFASDGDVPMAADIRAALLQVPLEGAGGDDLIAMLRQLIELRQDRVPVAIAMRMGGMADNPSLILLQEPTAGLTNRGLFEIPERFTEQ